MRSVPCCARRRIGQDAGRRAVRATAASTARTPSPVLRPSRAAGRSTRHRVELVEPLAGLLGRREDLPARAGFLVFSGSAADRRRSSASTEIDEPPRPDVDGDSGRRLRPRRSFDRVRRTADTLSRPPRARRRRSRGRRSARLGSRATVRRISHRSWQRRAPSRRGAGLARACVRQLATPVAQPLGDVESSSSRRWRLSRSAARIRSRVLGHHDRAVGILLLRVRPGELATCWSAGRLLRGLELLAQLPAPPLDRAAAPLHHLVRAPE